MYGDEVKPLHDVRSYIASMDQNNSMKGNQSYMRMNSMSSASMA